MNTPSFRTVADLARLTRTSKGTIYRCVGDGRITAIRVGRQIRFRPEDVERIMREGTDALQSEPDPRGNAGRAEEYPRGSRGRASG